MGNLTKYTPEVTKTCEAIYKLHEKKRDNEKQRSYLGASIAGSVCDRYLWYAFRQCFVPKFDGRMLRLFETGQLEEARFIRELEGIGCEVVAGDENGKQIAVEWIGGHMGGHLDGMANGIPESPKTWHVVEFKTHNDKSFTKLKAVGVREAKPLHWAQMMLYMGGTKTDRALYLAVNKNDDELYSERVKFDSAEYKSILARMKRIIESIQPPDRVSDRRDDFRCKFCDAEDICFGIEDRLVPLPSITCRTCCHATPETDCEGGVWTCNRQDPSDGYVDRCVLNGTSNPCELHLLIPGLVLGYEPVDAGTDWIKFANDTGEFVHGAGDPTNSTTKDLTTRWLHDE